MNWLVRFPLSMFMPYAAAVTTATVIGMVAGFILYRSLVFHGSQRSLWLQIRDFIGVNIVAGAVTVLSALVRAACEEARWEGHRSISLCTYRDAPWNGPFYRRLGFREEPRPAAYLKRLREHEQALGLDACGVREVLVRDLDRSDRG